MLHIIVWEVTAITSLLQWLWEYYITLKYPTTRTINTNYCWSLDTLMMLKGARGLQQLFCYIYNALINVPGIMMKITIWWELKLFFRKDCVYDWIMDSHIQNSSRRSVGPIQLLLTIFDLNITIDNNFISQK